MTPNKITCPIGDEQCATLTHLSETIPQVQQICDDLAECGIDMPRAKETLAASKRIVDGLLALKKKMG